MRALKWIAGILGVVVLAAALVFFWEFLFKELIKRRDKI